jgi:hypothetical protein
LAILFGSFDVSHGKLVPALDGSLEKRIFILHREWTFAQKWAQHHRTADFKFIDVAAIYRTR